MSRAAIAQRCCSPVLPLDPRTPSPTTLMPTHLNINVEKKSLLNLNDGDYQKSQSNLAHHRAISVMLLLLLHMAHPDGRRRMMVTTVVAVVTIVVIVR